MFFGTHISKIDAKKRASVPAAFRNHILAGSPDVKGIAVFPSLKAGDPAYMACSPEYLLTLDERIQEADLDPEEADRIASGVFSYMEMLPFDDGGRVVLSERLRQHIGVEKEVAFVGKGSQRFEIWGPDTHEAMSMPQREAVGPNALSILFKRKPRLGDGGGDGGR